MKNIKLILAICLLSISFFKVNAQCNPSFTTTITGHNLFCVATQTNNTTAHIWYLGDGTIRYGTTVNYNYTNAGSYLVKHVIRNSTGVCYDSSQLNISIIDSPCNWHATFTYNKTAPKTVNFFGQPGGGNKYYYWNFGDNTTSGNQNPTHTFANFGTYNVRLVVRDIYNVACRDTIYKVVTLIDSTCTWHATFTSNTVGIRTKAFFGLPTGSTKGYTWNFGDNTSSTLQNPIHTYATDGNYTVKLIVRDTINGCRDSVTNIITAIDSTCSWQASFTHNTIATKTKAFFGLPNGTTKRYGWNFGDNTSSTLQNPTHTYTTVGNYNVWLIVRDTLNNCRDTIFQTINIIDSITCNLQAQIYSSNYGPRTKYYSGYIMNSSDYINKKYTWNFGDGTSSNLQSLAHTYALAGTYTVKLIVKDTITNCIDSISKIHTVKDCSIQSYLNSQIVNNKKVNFSAWAYNGGSGSNKFSYQWNFGDGTTSTQQNIQHTYSNFGTYNVKLIARDTINNCRDTVYKTINLNDSNSCSWNAAFTSTVSSINNRQYTFHATPNNSSYNYNWSFGDGGYSYGTNANPVHTYTNAGTYTASVRITSGNNQCTDTTFSIVSIAPSIADSCTIDFTHTVPSAGNLQLTALSNQNIITQVWKIYHNGILVNSNLMNPLIPFTESGLYQIYLTITTSTGCQKSLWKNITLATLNGRMSNNDAKLYPNPTTNVLNYSIYLTSKEEINWRVLGIDGTIKSNGVFKAIAGDNKYLLPIENLRAGSYIFEYRTSEEKKSMRFQKM